MISAYDDSRFLRRRIDATMPGVIDGDLRRVNGYWSVNYGTHLDEVDQVCGLCFPLSPGFVLTVFGLRFRCGMWFPRKVVRPFRGFKMSADGHFVGGM